MSLALSTGVTGLKAYQQMLDVAGNNLANVGTTGFKASRITFAQLLAATIKNASQPTANVGGSNPQQMGSGVGISGINPSMVQGNIINTGNPLDLAIEGEGFFTLSDAEKNVYTRAGTFGVDANSYLVDPSTGYRVQRTGSEGEADGFQVAGDSNIRVPYDAALPASATATMAVQGNLSPDAAAETTRTQTLRSTVAYTVSNTSATTTTLLKDLDQFSGSFSGTGTITITGRKKDGTALPTGSNTLSVDATTTIQDLLDTINTVAAGEGTATLSGGKIILTGASSGYSKLDLNMTYTPSAGKESLTMPAYFEYSVVGGTEVQNVNITIFDSLGAPHVLAGSLVRTDAPNRWDMVITSVSGNVSKLEYADRRIEGIEFNSTDGSYVGLNSTIGDSAQFTVTFAHDTSNPQVISVDLGTPTKFDGLTQFATGETGTSTAVIKEQDGYASGSLTNVSVNKEGTLIGLFSNGVKKNLATLQIGLFQNPTGLESIDNGYYIPSANSGNAVAVQGMAGGAGTIHGGALEKSNVQEADEFISMIQAQNAYQANARTIRIANEMLRELTNLIR